jgi:hypothetical protein
LAPVKKILLIGTCLCKKKFKNISSISWKFFIYLIRFSVHSKTFSGVKISDKNVLTEPLRPGQERMKGKTGLPGKDDSARKGMAGLEGQGEADRTGQPGRDFQEGQPGQKNQDRTAKTGQLEWDCKDRSARTKLTGIRQPGEGS